MMRADAAVEGSALDVLLDAFATSGKLAGRPVCASDRIDDLGLDSLSFILLLLELQEAHPNLRIDLDRIPEAETVGGLADIISVARAVDSE